MSRLLTLLAVLSLVVAACAGATVDSASGGVGDDSSGAPSSSTAPDGETSDSVAGQDEPTSSTAGRTPPEGPAAPDFTLALEPSGEFVLSQEVKPVYMVFWAEW